ncbi:MAG: 2OG-Fe(II) oxygenase family protein, partial [Paracoccaceae bacterium]
FGVLTILMQDMQGGLQVRNLAGDWIEAPPVQGTLVCNIGDLLERWTGGRLTSTVHRVINRNPTNRYSIPIFCDPASETPIDPRDFGASDSAKDVITLWGAIPKTLGITNQRSRHNECALKRFENPHVGGSIPPPGATF